jgi:DNA-binding beta-propeller fold protein YncE
MVIALARTADPKKPEQGDGRGDALEAMLDVGRSPVHLALKPDGGELFVSNFDADSISEIVTGTNDVGGAYLVGSHPVRGLVNQDNTLLYVSNFSSQEISIYSIDDSKRTGMIHVGDGPDAMAFSSSGQLLFAVDARSSDLAVIRTNTQCFDRSSLQSRDCQSLFTLLPTGRQPNAIAIKAFKVQ